MSDPQQEQQKPQFYIRGNGRDGNAVEVVNAAGERQSLHRSVQSAIAAYGPLRQFKAKGA